MRNTRCSGVPQNQCARGSSGFFWDLPLALPEMPHALEDQRLGRWSLALCPLSPLLSAGLGHLERAILSSAALDSDPAALWRNPLPLPRMPLQFRQFPGLQGKA
jgi:hypothetical protein